MKKTLCILLLSAMMFCTLAACGDAGSSDTPAVTTAADASEITEETTTEEPGPDLPEADYDGYEFRVINRGLNDGSTHWYIFDVIDYEDRVGDIVNDAVLERNQYIEETYNIKMVQIETTSYESVAKSAILAASDDFDVYGESIASGSALAAAGLMVDLYTMPYIDLDAAWWDQNANEQMSIGGKLYTTVNDWTLMDKHGTWITMFTKSVIENFNLESPYDLVLNGEWTLDKMLEMAEKVTFEVDGDGTMNEFDSFGVVGESFNINALMVGAGVRMFTKNSDDIPEITLNGERQQNAFEKAFNIRKPNNVNLMVDKVKGTYTDVHVDCFGSMMEDGRVLFLVTGMNRVILFRSMETDFGVLPQPKYDENQEEYSVIMTYGNTNALSIPVTCSDFERTGLLMEAITYQSHKTSYPAYIEKSIKTKYSRDEESVAMMDIIFKNRTFDLGIIFNWGSCNSFYTGMVTSTSPDYASTIAKNEANYTSKMEATIELFESLS